MSDSKSHHVVFQLLEQMECWK